MKTLFGISTIFLIVGLLVAPGCAFAAEFSSTGNSASDFKLSSSSEKINPEVKGGEEEVEVVPVLQVVLK